MTAKEFWDKQMDNWPIVDDSAINYHRTSFSKKEVLHFAQKYGEVCWNEAIEEAAESAEAIIGINDKPIVGKQSILKLKKL